MGGGIIQLVAQGIHDVHITGNPQITFFKQLYKRHTVFAMERFQQYPIGNINWGNKLTFNIQRKADLLGPCYLEFILEFIHDQNKKLTFDEIRQHLISNKQNNGLSKSLGYSFIDYIDIEIGGTLIDTHTGHWLAIKSALTKSFNERIQDVFITGGFYRASHISPNAIYISVPLQFWFNINPGLYLPLIALQHHEVKINVKLNPLHKILLNNTNTGGGLNGIEHTIYDINIVEFNLFADYIYLDKEERTKFAQNNHEYLIEQVQILPGEYCNSSNQIMLIPLIFNHPIKELIWTLHNRIDMDILGPMWSGEKDRIQYVKLHLNGSPRFADDTPGIYFQTIQHHQHHNGLDLEKFFTELSGFMSGSVKQLEGVNKDVVGPVTELDPFIYSFALHPDKYQPSGSCNFSRLDNAVLTLIMNIQIPTPLNGLEVRIYGTNFNILKITKGMGGLVYSN